MTPAARVSAAIEVLADIEARRRPAADALKDWGLSHRFAGSGDRAAIAGLVYDALRRKASAALIMGEATPRAVLLGMLRARARARCRRDRGGLPTARALRPAPLTDAERDAAASGDARRRAAPCRRRLSGMARSASRRAPSARSAPRRARRWRARAPLDLRVNTLKAEREKAADALAASRSAADALVAVGLAHRARRRGQEPGDPRRAGLPQGPGRGAGRGLAARRAACAAPSRASRSSTCAPAPAARRWRSPPRWRTAARSTRPITDKRRLAPIHAASGARRRAQRAGAHAARQEDALADSAGRADLVLIDAPCTGTGAWRRNPDAKWRVRPGALASALKEQAAALDRAAAAGEAGRPHRLRHLLGARRGERRAGARLPRAPSGLRDHAAGRSRRARSASAPSCSAAPC